MCQNAEWNSSVAVVVPQYSSDAVRRKNSHHGEEQLSRLRGRLFARAGVRMSERRLQHRRYV